MLLPARRSLLAVLLATLAAGACTDTFEPLEQNDVKFSVFGYLDAGADTQWVRVMPLRELAVTSRDSLDTRVTLENLRTGRVIELRDSLFRFAARDVGTEGRFLHNYWTTEKLEPGTSYRFSAVRGGEDPSRAEVKLPPDYETEMWISQRPPLGRDTLWLGGLRYVARVWAITEFRDACGRAVQRSDFLHASAASDTQRVPITLVLQRSPQCGPPIIDKRELWIVGSGAPWPSGRDYLTNRLGGAGDTLGISGSVGFLGGVLTKVVPYETCTLVVQGPIVEPCKLRYGPETATLVGKALDLTCPHIPLANVFAILREIDTPPGAPVKIRDDVGRETGEFSIGGLEAGKRYSLRMRRPYPSVGGDQFQEYGDTLVFAPGERREYVARMTRASPECEPNG